MTWSNENDIRVQLQKLWSQGTLLSWLVSDDPTAATPFPIRLKFKKPTSREITENFASVQKWIAEVNAISNSRLVNREFRHSIFGRNSIPEEVWIDTAGDATAWLDKDAEMNSFVAVVRRTRERMPALLPWLERKPLLALAHATDWELILDVVCWLEKHPRPGIYLRQVDIPRVHTKFIEQRKSILAQLFDQILPDSAIDHSASPTLQFERRYGFRTKPERIRFRLLNEPERDISLDSTSFASLKADVRIVFIVENEINFLCFPTIEKSMVLFGAGYGFEALGEAKWLSECNLFYWGDIDTHGFAMLHELRRHFPHVQSLLMDEATVLHYLAMCGQEKEPHTAREFSNLTIAEKHVYSMIKAGAWKDRLRIEQEHIDWEYALKAICVVSASRLVF